MRVWKWMGFMQEVLLRCQSTTLLQVRRNGFGVGQEGDGDREESTGNKEGRNEEGATR